MNLNTRNKAEQFDFIEIEREWKIETLCYNFILKVTELRFLKCMHSR